jgi:2-polyprenyl-3-methyl-5-hydroxy-6-metoxy-1,4-benzoquinol methylase
MVEYGCGVAPMTNFLLENFDVSKINFTLIDVPGEHLEFAKWRLKKKIDNNNLRLIEITADRLIPSHCEENFDFVCIMDVYEHLPNPLNVTNWLLSKMNPGSVMVETWVKHPDGPGEADLLEAEEQRDETMKLLEQSTILLENSGGIRIRQKQRPKERVQISSDPYLKQWLDD